MAWTEKQLKSHRESARLLYSIVEQVFELLKNKPATEYEVRDFIMSKFREDNIIPDKDPPTVAFRENTANVYYVVNQKTTKKLEKDSLILIDMWARKKINGLPFADITWMAYKGEKIPQNLTDTFNILLEARDQAFSFIKFSLKDGVVPTGNEVHEQLINVFVKHKVKDKFLHTTGHPLGFYSCHGNVPWICKSNKKKLSFDQPYSMEPGLYFENDFGMRTESNFLITKDMKLELTTPLQKEIILL